MPPAQDATCLTRDFTPPCHAHLCTRQGYLLRRPRIRTSECKSCPALRRFRTPPRRWGMVDDAAMGVTEVVRGCDLLLSAAQQLYLYQLLDLTPPAYAHIPLICNAEGRRLSKRDKSLDMGNLRQNHTPGQIIGYLAYTAGLTSSPMPISAHDLIGHFAWSKITAAAKIICATKLW